MTGGVYWRKKETVEENVLLDHGMWTRNLSPSAVSAFFLHLFSPPLILSVLEILIK